jgi:hypothetical protein
MAVALSRKLPLVPAEDPQPARPAELRFHLLLLALAVALGVLLQLCGPARLQIVFAQVKLDSLAGVSALLLALFASMIAHELGHLLAALFLDYEVLGAALGPLQFDFLNSHGRVRLVAGPWFRCSVSAVPRAMPSAWRARMMIVVAAGPAVSLLALCLTTVISIDAIGPAVLGGFWSSCVEVNFFLFVLGLVPNGRFAKMRNDAALFLALCKNDSDAADMRVCHQAIELSLRRIRPEDYPQDLLSELADFRGSSYTRLMVARRMIEWAVDCGNIEQAGAWVQSALALSEQCGAYWANTILAESACFDVLFRADAGAAGRKFAGVEWKALFPPYFAERAQAVCSLAVGRAQEAPRHILRAQYQLPVGNPYYHYERSLLDNLHYKVLALTSPSTQTEVLMF